MVSVFISHSSVDKPFVRELAAFLERDALIRVWLDERELEPGQNIVDGIADGLESDFVLLILSPASVESPWVNEEWTDAYWEQINARSTKLLGVLYRHCVIPRLLRNKKYFDLRSNHPEGFREIKTFLLTGRPAAPVRVNYLPVRPPTFVGREPELAALRDRLRTPGSLVAVTGLAGKGKTTLALEFAHRHQAEFDAVYWIPCQRSSLAAMTAELSRQLGLKLDGDQSEIARELQGFCASKRCLLILDDVQDETAADLIPGGVASVLVTTRLSTLRFLRAYRPVALPLFTDDQCFEIFRAQVGPDDVARHERECRELFERLGHLPLAVGIAAALIREDVRYTIPILAHELPSDVTALIREAITALDAPSRHLLAAMAACAPESFYLDLAADIAEFDEREALDALQPAIARSLVDEVDRAQRRYRLHALVREAATETAMARQHAEVVQSRFWDWEMTWRRCEQELPDFQLALEWGLNVNAPWADALAYVGYELSRRVGRLAEAFEICERLRRVSDEQQNRSALSEWLGNQAVILHAWGRLDEALALHKQGEAICVELGDEDGLQASYGNQARILNAWGRLDEALALHKQQEAICVELGDKDGLAVCYGNQAVILHVRGRLDEALALHKQEEAICVELGNKNGLQVSYGNQALILRAWGRPDEALALHKQEEAICVELGHKDGLQRSYGNQAVILQAWGRLHEALALHKQEEAICVELGDEYGLQASYANQAVILHAWGRLDEALALHKQQEAICVELGNKDGLQQSYGSQGVILKTWGRLDEALALHKQQEAICVELGNKDGLQQSYGSQGEILEAWGRLDEALALHKQEEAICVELGNKDGLQQSYGNQGVILRAWGRLDEALALHKQEEAICVELGNKDGLQRSYGNQGVILKSWGRLDEALALHKQQEAICIELGNKEGLAYAYWSWGLLERAFGHPEKEIAKLSDALTLFSDLGMISQRDSVERELRNQR